MIIQKQIMISTWDHQPVPSVSLWRLVALNVACLIGSTGENPHGSSGWPKATMLRYCALPARDRDRSEAIIIDGEARRKRPRANSPGVRKKLSSLGMWCQPRMFHSGWLTTVLSCFILKLVMSFATEMAHPGFIYPRLALNFTCWFLLWTCPQETIHGNLNSGVRQVIVWTTKWVICTCKLPHSVVHRKFKHFSLVNISYYFNIWDLTYQHQSLTCKSM